MKTTLCFSACGCVAPNTSSIQALIQKEFDGVYVHFILLCLYCDHESHIKETLEFCGQLPEYEKEVLKWLETDQTKFLLEFCKTGVPISIPQDYKKPRGEQNENSSVL